MAIKLKPLSQQVIVIVGGSSGIGLATAQAAAAEGAKLVVAARSGEVLERVVQEINDKGGEAIHVVADVSRREDVQRIADAAIEQFGGFDTWIHNASVAVFGLLEEISLEDHQRLVDVNFWGVVHGSLVAVEHLKNRGGALVVTGSLASDLGFPLQGMYTASKHAVKGFINSLRIELSAQGAPVSVTLVKPAGINTPFDHHARNYMPQEPQLPPPVYEPKEVAFALLHAAGHPEREIYVGGGGKMMSTLYKHVPSLVDWFNQKAMIPLQKRNETPRQPLGTLYQGSNDGQVRGDWPGYVMKNSLYTRASVSPLVKAGGLFGLGLLAYAVFTGKEGRNKRQ